VTEEAAIAVLDVYPTLSSLARAYSLLVSLLLKLLVCPPVFEQRKIRISFVPECRANSHIYEKWGN